MNLAAVMTAVGDRLDTITGLTVHRFPPDTLSPPAAVVAYPETVIFDDTYGRGTDKIELPVVIVVGKVSVRVARTKLAAYCDGTGAQSVKQVLESGTYTAFSAVRVQSIDFDVVTIGGTDYLAAVFTLDIGGSGT